MCTKNIRTAASVWKFYLSRRAYGSGEIKKKCTNKLLLYRARSSRRRRRGALAVWFAEAFSSGTPFERLILKPDSFVRNIVIMQIVTKKRLYEKPDSIGSTSKYSESLVILNELLTAVYRYNNAL